MIDWSLAGQVARGIAGLQPAGDPVPFRDVAGPAAESERLVVRVHRARAGGAAAARRGGRPGEWIEANLRSLGAVLDPVADRIGGKLGPLGGRPPGRCSALEAGALTGFLAGRVLGQYEFPVLDPSAPARLLFVAPNLGARREHARGRPGPAAALGRPARDHARAPVRRRAMAARAPGRARPATAERRRGRRARRCCGCPTSRTWRRCSNSVREDGLASVVAGPRAPRRCSRPLQATMALLEGYAEHVMDAVGAGLLDDLDATARGDDPPARRALRPAAACSSA